MMNSNIKIDSYLMFFFKKISLEKIAWSLRRLYCPVKKDDLVLDVGSGGNPYPRANVLLDAYEDTIERFNIPLVKDRPIVFGFVENLPFKDKSFDFVIASHILEHIAEPEKFLNELMRVAKSGYIETPDGFFERMNPFTFHRLEIYDFNDKLQIFKKPSWRHDTIIVDSYEHKMKDKKFIKFLSKHPAPFYVRYYWKAKIDYEILNPEINSNWPFLVQCNQQKKQSIKFNLRNSIVKIIRYIFSQNKKNKKINLMNILRCPSCKSDNLFKISKDIKCNNCEAIYPVIDGIPRMYN